MLNCVYSVVSVINLNAVADGREDERQREKLQERKQQSNLFREGEVH